MDFLNDSSDNLSFLIGHNEQAALLESFISNQKLPSAILLSGRKGLGKGLAATEFAKKLLSPQNIEEDNGMESLFGEAEAPKTSAPVLRIDSETASMVDNESHPDLKIIRKEEDKTNISIDQVRKIGSFFGHSSSIAAHKIIIIDCADDLNGNSANAILKTLEEPNKNSLIVLISNDKYKLLPTIRSRCVEIDFFPLSQENFYKVLEAKGYKDCSAEIAEISQNSPGEAIAAIESGILDASERFLSLMKDGSPKVADIMKISSEIKKNKEGNWLIFKNYLLNAVKKSVIEKKASPEIFTKTAEIFSQIDSHNMDISDSLKSIIYNYKYC